jgi:hypothetical protein
MTPWFETYKPAVSSRNQLLLAAALWTIVGVMLLTFGTIWIFCRGDKTISLFIFLVAVGLGLLKNSLVLDRTANSIAYRIVQRGEGRCVGSFFSLRTWALVGCMIVLGRLLRGMNVPLQFLGLLYAAVGIGLLISSRSIWLAWKDHGKAER